MSINPELFNLRETGELIPSLIDDEYMVMSRKSIRFGLEDTNEKFRGNGNVYVTNKRLILVKNKNVNKPSNFVSLCLPLSNIYTLEFKQPILLASYLQGFVKPNKDSIYPLTNDSKWWISFHSGGCSTFVRSFYKLYLKTLKEDSSTNNEYRGFGNDNMAFIDKTDPTIIYIQES